MSDPFIGQISLFGFNFPPRGWATCSGQILPIAQNTALFSLLGTTYGGDGRTTFALPDLRGRVPIHQGQGPGLSDYVIGQAGGQETITLLESQMPPHTHDLFGVQGTGTTGRGVATTPTDVQRNLTDRMSVEGGGQPHDNVQPYLTVNYCIALQGIFPSRN